MLSPRIADIWSGLVAFFLTTHAASAKVTNPKFDLKQAAMGAFAAMTIASSVITAPPAQASVFSSSNIISEKVVREGLYRDYEVDIVQEKDNAESTFKSAKETKSKKGKSTMCEYCSISRCNHPNLEPVPS